MNSTIILHSTLSPDAAAGALRQSIDEEIRTLFSFSGYAGDRPVLGEINGNEFRLQKRRHWRNDYAPHFYGEFGPEPGGTRIEGYFDFARRVKRFMRFWLAGVVLIGAPAAVVVIRDVLTGRHRLTGDTWVGVIVPPAMFVFGIFLPKLGRLMGRPEEGFILEFLEHTLAGQRERPSVS